MWPFEVYGPEIEWYSGFDGLGFEQVYRGHDGVRAYWRHWLEAWESIEFHLDDVIDAGDQVVALIWQGSRESRGNRVRVRAGLEPAQWPGHAPTQL